MMTRHFPIALCLVFSTAIIASEIERISLSELESRATYIVLATVVNVVERDDQDQVTINVDSYLKGESPQTVYTFTLITRGGLKDFDPSLEEGDSGVFFLKQLRVEGQVAKAYWGSVAIFPKNNFNPTNGID